VRRNDIRNLVIIAHVATARPRWWIACCASAGSFASRSCRVNDTRHERPGA